MADGSDMISGSNHRRHVDVVQRGVLGQDDLVDRIDKGAPALAALTEELACAKDAVKRARRNAEESVRRANSVLDAVVDGIFSVDPRGIVESANASAFRMLNCSASGLIGAPLARFLIDFEIGKGTSGTARTKPGGLAAMVGKRVSCMARPQDAEPFPVEMILSRAPLQGKLRFTCVMRDVTEQRKAEQEIRKLALLDQLTSIPNRYAFEGRLKTAIQLADRQDASVALMLLDLDKFKDVNDSFGHPIGDELLKHAARVLEESVRESDTVARIGGDEFAIILMNVEDPLRVRQVAERVVAGLSQPAVLNGSLVVTGASIGISIYPRDATEAKELVRLGDQALYEAKKQGRGTFQYYDEVMDANARAERILENDLRLAVARNEFELHFQPQIATRTGAIMAVESLIRWRHPGGVLKMPGEFIDHAEKTGIIADIGRQVLLAACREARRWHDMAVGVIPVAVNVSPGEIRDSGFVDSVTDALEQAGIGPEWLELEVTENAALDTSEAILDKLHVLNGLGVRIAVDDFGTGYASLAYLRKLPLRKLKIDRSLITNMGAGGTDQAITETIIDLGERLDFDSIAEGVENDGQADAVRQTLCTGMQGYLLTHPLPAEPFRDWLAGHHAGA